MKFSRLIAFVLCLGAAFGARWIPPKTGFVVHFDFISNVSEARSLVQIAARAGASVINVVPPARIWKSPPSLLMLDGILDEAKRLHLSLVFTRIDATYPPDSNGSRISYLYDRILNERGRMPDGQPTADYFLTTVGREGYAEWMEEETRYYASHYGRLPNLLGINLGPFSEPFSSQRGGFLEYMTGTHRYEITQYTPSGSKNWHQWLARTFGGIETMNREYGCSYRSFEEVPMPFNESDSRFGKPCLAYFDLVRSLNDWFVESYQRCRRIWHEVSGRADVPFILQLSGGEAEKIVKGRPAFVAFDMPGWIEMADALGLSLYTNSGFQDMGHASIEAILNLEAEARESGKAVFVLEGGNEAPNVTLDAVQLSYFGSAARWLHPRTYIYEFLKDKFAEEYRNNPGKLVTAAGEIRKPAFDELRKLFQEIRSHPEPPRRPALYAVSAVEAARLDSHLGIVNSALYDLASTISIRWLVSASKSALHSEVPVLYPDGSIKPPNEELSRLFRDIPDIGSRERRTWRQAVATALQR